MSLRENLARDAVGALPRQEAIQVGPTCATGEAIALMQQQRQGCVVIVEQGRPIGIFTERDVLTKLVPDGLASDTPIASVMTPDPEIVREGFSVSAVVHRMHRGGFRHLPVVDEGGQLTGVISVKRIVEYLVEHFPSAVFNLPPDPKQTFDEREGA